MPKTARNKEIIRLWNTDRYTPPQTAAKYGITQGRISAIIYHRLPIYRYCRLCKTRISDGRSICEVCSAKKASAIALSRAQRQADKDRRRAEREHAFLERREARQLAKVDKVIASQIRRVTCYLCGVILPERRKFCETCITTNKLNVGGAELTRGMVRGRDRNICQICGYVWKTTDKKRLDVHHLDGLCGKFSKSYDRPDMIHKLITVCHKRGGWANSDRSISGISA
jgi:hypothetical protein